MGLFLFFVPFRFPGRPIFHVSPLVKGFRKTKMEREGGAP